MLRLVPLLLLLGCSPLEKHSREEPYYHDHVLFLYELKYGSSINNLDKTIKEECEVYDHTLIDVETSSNLNCPKFKQTIDNHTCVNGVLFYNNMEVSDYVCQISPVFYLKDEYVYHYPLFTGIEVDVLTHKFLDQRKQLVKLVYDIDENQWGLINE